MGEAVSEPQGIEWIQDPLPGMTEEDLHWCELCCYMEDDDERS